MADEKVYVEAVFEAVSAIRNARTFSGAIDEVASRGRAAASALTPLAQAALNTTSNFGKMALLIGGVTAGFGALAAAGLGVRAVYGIIDAGTAIITQGIAKAKEYSAAFLGLQTVAGATGQSMSTATETARRLASDGLLSVSEAAAGLKNLLSKGLNLEQAERVMLSLKDTAAFGKQGFLEYGQAVVGATEGIRNGLSAMSDNAGVTKNLKDIYKDAGLQVSDIGGRFKTTAEAAKFEAQWLKETALQTGDAARLSGTLAGQLSRLDTAWDDLQATVGKVVVENANVRDVISELAGIVRDITQRLVEYTKGADVTTSALILMGRAAGTALGILQTGGSILLAAKIIHAELALAVFNLAAMYDTVNLKFLRFMAATSLNATNQAFYNAKVQEATDLVAANARTYQDSADAINKDHQLRDTWNAALDEGKARLDALTGQLEANRGKTVEVAASTSRLRKEHQELGDEAKKAAEKQKAAMQDAKFAVVDFFDKFNDKLGDLQDKEDKFWKEWVQDAREMRTEVLREIQALEAAIFASIDEQQKAQREYDNWLGERRMEREAEEIEHLQRVREFWREAYVSIGLDLVDILTDASMTAGEKMQAVFASAMQGVSRLAGTVIGGALGGPAGAALGGQIGSVLGRAFTNTFTAEANRAIDLVEGRVRNISTTPRFQGTIDTTPQDRARDMIEATNAVVLSLSKEFAAYQKIADAIDDARASIRELNRVQESGRGVEWQREMAEAQDRLNGALAEQRHIAGLAKDDLELMGLVAVAAYQAAIDAGLSHNEAIRAAGPAITQLVQAYKNLGLNAEDAGVKALMIQAGVLQSNPQLLAGIDGLAASFSTLANMGMLNAETFGTLAEAGKRMYTKLQGEVAALGGSTRDALLPMQGFLQEAAARAKELGIPLDEHTQMLIDQSKELGIWKEKGKSANELMIDGLTEIVALMKELVATLKGVPPEVNTNIKVTRETVDIGSGGGEIRHNGGLVGGGRFSSAQVRDVPITAQSGEFVVSRRGVAAVGLRRLYQINRGEEIDRTNPPPASGDGPRNSTQPVAPEQTVIAVTLPIIRDRELDPVAIGNMAAQAVVKHLPTNGFGIQTAIVDSVRDALAGEG